MSGNHYQQLYTHLKAGIVSGEYKIGDLLPSENQLSSKENLARSTVRNALAQLEKEGYIVKKKGKGSVVKSRRRALGILNHQGFSASIDSSDISTVSVLEPVVTEWFDDDHFNIDEETKKTNCIRFSRVRCIENDPVMLETSFFSNQYVSGFEKKYKTNESFFDFLAKEYSIEIIGMNQELKAIAIDSEKAKYLKVKEGTPTLLIYREYKTNNSALNIYSILYCDTEKYMMGNNNK